MKRQGQQWPCLFILFLDSAHPRSFKGTHKCPLHKREFFSLGMAVQGFALPDLRTVHAVLPHTALQSLVSSSGLARQ